MKPSVLTLERIRELREYAEANRIKPCVIRTKRQAKKATLNDAKLMSMFGREGRVWKVGDEYYFMGYIGPDGEKNEAPLKV